MRCIQCGIREQYSFGGKVYELCVVCGWSVLKTILAFVDDTDKSEEQKANENAECEKIMGVKGTSTNYSGHTPEGHLIEFSCAEINLELARGDDPLIVSARQPGNMAVYLLVFEVRAEKGRMLTSVPKALRDDPDVDLSEVFMSQILMALDIRLQE